MKLLGERSNLRMEFHISRQARDKYQFDESIFELNGNAILANFRAARNFAHKMNAQRDLVRHPERAVRAGSINAMGLIDEISHFVVRQYRLQRNPEVFNKAMAWLNQKLGEQEVRAALAHFADEFPPLRVYRQEIHLEDYLAAETEGIPHLHSVLEELLMLWLANVNPAFSPFKELFDHRSLENHTRYRELIETLDEFFETQPPFGPRNETLIKLLRAPALAAPNSLSDQLKFIRDYWSGILGKYLHHLISGLDLIQEEEKPIFPGPGPAIITGTGSVR